MARTPSFNFGANRKAKRGKTGKKSGKKSSKGKGTKSNAWRAYISNAPIPD